MDVTVTPSHRRRTRHDHDGIGELQLEVFKITRAPKLNANYAAFIRYPNCTMIVPVINYFWSFGSCDMSRPTCRGLLSTDLVIVTHATHSAVSHRHGPVVLSSIQIKN